MLKPERSSCLALRCGSLLLGCSLLGWCLPLSSRRLLHCLGSRRLGDTARLGLAEDNGGLLLYCWSLLRVSTVLCWTIEVRRLTTAGVLRTLLVFALGFAAAALVAGAFFVVVAFLAAGFFAGAFLVAAAVFGAALAGAFVVLALVAAGALAGGAAAGAAAGALLGPASFTVPDGPVGDDEVS